MKNPFGGHNSYQKFSLKGQNNGVLTKKQRAQSLRDKDKHQRQLTRAFAMALLNPPIVLKPFTHVGLPGTETDVLKLRRPDGRLAYFKTNSGSIMRTPDLVKK